MRPLREKAFVAPRTQVEHALAKHWAEILGLERVSIHDNFFELGGHSLIATQAVARIREALGVELRLRALFDHPTIADLARVIEQMQSSGAAPAPPAVAPVPREVYRVKSSQLRGRPDL